MDFDFDVFFTLFLPKYLHSQTMSVKVAYNTNIWAFCQL